MLANPPLHKDEGMLARLWRSRGGEGGVQETHRSALQKAHGTSLGRRDRLRYVCGIGQSTFSAFTIQQSFGIRVSGSKVPSDYIFQRQKHSLAYALANFCVKLKSQCHAKEASSVAPTQEGGFEESQTQYMCQGCRGKGQAYNKFDLARHHRNDK